MEHVVVTIVEMAFYFVPLRPMKVQLPNRALPALSNVNPKIFEFKKIDDSS